MFDKRETLRKFALNTARFSGLASISRRLGSGRGAILMLHRVKQRSVSPFDVNSHLAITPRFLDEVLAELKRLGHPLVSMDEVVERIGPSRGKPFVAITADDGYRDNLTEALPVLERHNAPITIFVAPALVDGTVHLWWDVLEEFIGKSNRIAFCEHGRELVLDCSTLEEKIAAHDRLQAYMTTAIPEERQTAFLHELACRNGFDLAALPRVLMDWQEIREIAAHPLVTIGAHTVHHYNLLRLPTDAVCRELRESARILTDRLGRTPRHFAYPYGYGAAVGAREVELASQAGYASAVTTRHGLIRAEHARHLHALPRISLNGRYQQIGYVRTMLSGVTTPLANRGRLVVTV